MSDTVHSSQESSRAQPQAGNSPGTRTGGSLFSGVGAGDKLALPEDLARKSAMAQAAPQGEVGPPPQDSSLWLKLGATGLALLLLAVLVTAFTAGTGKQGSSQPGDANESEQDVLGTVWEIFDPTKVGISTDSETGIDRLNSWLEQKYPQYEFELNLPAEVMSRLSSDENFNQVQWMRDYSFGSVDAEHLRDCTLLQSVSKYAVGSAKKELDQAVQVFEHVVRTVDLMPGHPQDVPLTLSESYILGQGTATDRLWIFAGLLKQLKIDMVVLLPPKMDTTTPQGEVERLQRIWPLAGVLLGSEVYLFDPLLGLPLWVSGNGSRQVATLSSLRANPGWLENWGRDAEHRYRWTREDLARPRIGLVGHSSWWAPRMELLQASLTGKQSLIVYDGLADSAAGPGLWSRVAKFPKAPWTVGDIVIWQYPERQLTRHDEMDDAKLQVLNQLKMSWGLSIVSGTKTTLEDVSRTNSATKTEARVSNFLVLRMMQVVGDFEEAVKLYTSARQQAVERLEFFERLGDLSQIEKPEERAQLQARRDRDAPRCRLVAPDSHYWTGLCQWEQQHYDLAAITFKKYLELAEKAQQNPTPTQLFYRWSNACRWNLAQAYYVQGQKALALEMLASIPDAAPQAEGARVLARLWSGEGVSARKN